ncbi:hypothetical protein SBOR_10161 [Sclerotinia borealis F-4128]|uniref:Uncharacterized protein n=1 Tax=Sclerotinia borealis (strain F-4128) TaxID=1432307 RepID=W9C4H0_SCLBF|nr:hypothetical protein SBOR_10161 [Sclerotinia borealis F-4128]
MKQPGVILVNEWEGRNPQRDITKILGKELRAYAYEYKCPQVFAYDGIHLLVVQFKAKDDEDIKSLHCRVDCCILARTPEGAQCTARFALYRLAWRGWMRMIGVWSADFHVSIVGWRREFRYWSGRPGWVNEQDPRRKELDHPDGYMRRFDLTKKAWYWVDVQRNPVLDVYGNTIWDSIQSLP